jgi:hypothetical protein
MTISLGVGLSGSSCVIWTKDSVDWVQIFWIDSSEVSAWMFVDEVGEGVE